MHDSALMEMHDPIQLTVHPRPDSLLSNQSISLSLHSGRAHRESNHIPHIQLHKPHTAHQNYRVHTEFE